jgi:host factor-I protein
MVSSNQRGKPHRPDAAYGEASTMNRKLIRPNLTEIKERMSQDKEREKDASHRRMHPPTDTFAESYYFLKQMNKKTPMAVVYTSGEIVEGYVEWYDRSCIKLNRDNAPNLLIYKSSIRCIYKAAESPEEGEPSGGK